MLEKKEEPRCLSWFEAWKAEASGAASLGQNVPEGGL